MRWLQPEEMEILAQINGRQVHYLWINQNPGWAEQLPTENWLLIPIGHKPDKEIIAKAAEECLGRGVNYVAALGQACELIHDIFDEEVVLRKIQKGERVDREEDFEREPMTTWHHDFNEGVWFATTVAYDEYNDIHQVICLDLTERGEKDRLTQILDKIQAGG